MTFLSTWTFRLICTLTALAVVWVHEIRAPVSWFLIVPALAFDIWRLVTPDDFAEGGPHHRFWHNPNAPHGIFGLLCLGMLLLAPLFRFSCFPDINDVVSPYFGMVSRKLVDAGGVCETRYGNLILLYFVIIPFCVVFSIIYTLYICKRDKNRIKNYNNFKPSDHKEPKIYGIIVVCLILFLVFWGSSTIPFDHYGSRPYAPVDLIVSLGLLLAFNYVPTFGLAAGCGLFCYVQIQMEKRNVRANKH